MCSCHSTPNRINLFPEATQLSTSPQNLLPHRMQCLRENKNRKRIEGGKTVKLKIGENIKYLRKTRDITQETLAEMLGISSQSVSR